MRNIIIFWTIIFALVMIPDWVTYRPESVSAPDWSTMFSSWNPWLFIYDDLLHTLQVIRDWVIATMFGQGISWHLRLSSSIIILLNLLVIVAYGNEYARENNTTGRKAEGSPDTN